MNFDIDTVPKTEEERIAIMSTIKAQTKEVLRDKTIITCGKCRCEVRIIHTYRCFYCGIIFCTRCAEKHFEKVERENET